MAFGIYAKIYANANNPGKNQQPINGNDSSLPGFAGKTAYQPASARGDNMPRKFQHERDIKARELLVATKKREHNRANANIPPERVYDARTKDVGWDHNRVTLSGNSSITWDRNSQKWVPSAYHAPKPIERIAKEVRHQVRGGLATSAGWKTVGRR